jgi:hypothetical protein
VYLGTTRELVALADRNPTIDVGDSQAFEDIFEHGAAPFLVLEWKQMLIDAPIILISAKPSPRGLGLGVHSEVNVELTPASARMPRRIGPPGL